MTDVDYWLDIRQLSELMGLSTRTIYNLMNQGSERIPSPVRHGKTLRWRLSNVLNFMDVQEKHPTMVGVVPVKKGWVGFMLYQGQRRVTEPNRNMKSALAQASSMMPGPISIAS